MPHFCGMGRRPSEARHETRARGALSGIARRARRQHQVRSHAETDGSGGERNGRNDTERLATVGGVESLLVATLVLVAIRVDGALLSEYQHARDGARYEPGNADAPDDVTERL